MATIEYLVATHKLKKHEPDLEHDELPGRIIYFAPEFDEWLRGTLQAVGKLRGRDLTPCEQVEQILYEFVINRPMAGDVRRFVSRQ